MIPSPQYQYPHHSPLGTSTAHLYSLNSPRFINLLMTSFQTITVPTLGSESSTNNPRSAPCSHPANSFLFPLLQSGSHAYTSVDSSGFDRKSYLTSTTLKFPRSLFKTLRFQFYLQQVPLSHLNIVRSPILSSQKA